MTVTSRDMLKQTHGGITKANAFITTVFHKCFRLKACSNNAPIHWHSEENIYFLKLASITKQEDAHWGFSEVMKLRCVLMLIIHFSEQLCFPGIYFTMG